MGKIFCSLLTLKGGYVDFSPLIELENTHITEIYMKKTMQIIND